MDIDLTMWQAIFLTCVPLFTIVFAALIVEFFEIKLHWTVICLTMLIVAFVVVMV